MAGTTPRCRRNCQKLPQFFQCSGAGKIIKTALRKKQSENFQFALKVTKNRISGENQRQSTCLYKKLYS